MPDSPTSESWRPRRHVVHRAAVPNCRTGAEREPRHPIGAVGCRRRPSRRWSRHAPRRSGVASPPRGTTVLPTSQHRPPLLAQYQLTPQLSLFRQFPGTGRIQSRYTFVRDRSLDGPAVERRRQGEARGRGPSSWRRISEPYPQSLLCDDRALPRVRRRGGRLEEPMIRLLRSSRRRLDVGGLCPRA